MIGDLPKAANRLVEGLAEVFSSRDLRTPKGRRANVVDGLFQVAEAIDHLAEAVRHHGHTLAQGGERQ